VPSTAVRTTAVSCLSNYDSLLSVLDPSEFVDDFLLNIAYRRHMKRGFTQFKVCEQFAQVSNRQVYSYTPVQLFLKLR